MTISSVWPPIHQGTITPAATNIYQAYAVGVPPLTPQIVANIYGVPYNTGANTKIGIIGFAGAGWPGDLANSISNMGLSTPTVTYIAVDGQPLIFGANVNGTSAWDSWVEELTLDIYSVAGVVPGANISVYLANLAYGGPGSNSYNPNSTQSFANAVQRAINENCDIITMSVCTTEYSGVINSLEPVFANAVSKGITLLAATGDTGSDDFVNPGFEGVTYPSTSPNVIAVGGTSLFLTAGNTRQNEVIADFSFPPLFGGGGGISSYFTAPTYQANLYYTPYWRANNHTGSSTLLTYRGVPDISGPMNYYGLWYGNSVIALGGTSASTPVMAGILGRYISANGGKRPPISYFYTSPARIFYSNINIFNKNTGNVNLTTGNSDVGNVGGYLSTTGWDPVTGLGVPLGNSTYQAFTSGGNRIKTAANTWSYVANVQVKTAANTWANVRSIYTKTVNGWQQTF
jgi:kumamolisin